MNARDSTTVTTNENFFLKYKLPTSKGKLEFLADIYAKFGVSTTTNPLNRMRQNILDLILTNFLPFVLSLYIISIFNINIKVKYHFI